MESKRKKKRYRLSLGGDRTMDHPSDLVFFTYDYIKSRGKDLWSIIGDARSRRRSDLYTRGTRLAAIPASLCSCSTASPLKAIDKKIETALTLRAGDTPRCLSLLLLSQCFFADMVPCPLRWFLYHPQLFPCLIYLFITQVQTDEGHRSRKY